MLNPGPVLPERREALLSAARFLVGESGVEAGALLDPALAVDLASALAQDIGAAIDRRTAGVETVDDLAEALVAAAHEGAEPWRDSLALANVGVERLVDYEAWLRVAEPWIAAVERAVKRAQKRGMVPDDVDAGTVALAVRDATDRSVNATMRFGRKGYRDVATVLVRGALRA